MISYFGLTRSEKIVIISMTLLMISGLIFYVLYSYSRNNYWINGEGSWDDSSHWSKGHTPTSDENVIFDKNSFPQQGGTIVIR